MRRRCYGCRVLFSHARANQPQKSFERIPMRIDVRGKEKQPNETHCALCVVYMLCLAECVFIYVCARRINTLGRVSNFLLVFAPLALAKSHVVSRSCDSLTPTACFSSYPLGNFSKLCYFVFKASTGKLMPTADYLTLFPSSAHPLAVLFHCTQRVSSVPERGKKKETLVVSFSHFHARRLISRSGYALVYIHKKNNQKHTIPF
jgi:hypothetical protein